jgi:bifunctional ADP-heptose synthase (sugar kinase/adenylyltransferase)
MAPGNLAAGIVVKKVGTAVTSQKEMLDTLETISMFK